MSQSGIEPLPEPCEGPILTVIILGLTTKILESFIIYYKIDDYLLPNNVFLYKKIEASLINVSNSNWKPIKTITIYYHLR